MEAALKKTIDRQVAYLIQQLRDPMGVVAAACAVALEDPIQLDMTISNRFTLLPSPQLAYVLDPYGVQISGNIHPNRIDIQAKGQDLSGRPYLIRPGECSGLMLSSAYVSRVSRRACITALQPIVRDGAAIACLCVDFDLSALPQTDRGAVASRTWRQVKGDPAIRGNLFQQERVYSAMDERLDDVIAITNQLVCEHGIFHAKLHFSSSRATLWHFDDPFSYQIHVLDEIIDPAVCLAYRHQSYDARATVAATKVQPILERFRELRNADSTIYLRAASVNVVNGMVGLNFSCDGSHYMPADDFLAKEPSFWFGAGAPDDPAPRTGACAA